MKQFLSLAFTLLFHPKKAAQTIGEGVPFGYAILGITLRWVFTWGTIFLAFLLGRQPFVAPFVSIPAESYYYYELFFLIPFGIVLWIVVSGCAQVLVFIMGEGDKFRAILTFYSILAFATWPLYGIPDLICIITGNWNQSIIIPVHTVAALLEVYFSTRILKYFTGLGWAACIMIGLISTFIYRPIAVLLIR
jgi:hypothetical protein